MGSKTRLSGRRGRLTQHLAETRREGEPHRTLRASRDAHWSGEHVHPVPSRGGGSTWIGVTDLEQTIDLAAGVRRVGGDQVVPSAHECADGLHRLDPLVVNGLHQRRRCRDAVRCTASIGCRIVCAPAAANAVVHVAIPLVSGTVSHSAVAASANVTPPVAEAGVTLAVNVTDWPIRLGFWEEVSEVVVRMGAIVPDTICAAVSGVSPLSATSMV